MSIRIDFVYGRKQEFFRAKPPVTRLIFDGMLFLNIAVAPALAVIAAGFNVRNSGQQECVKGVFATSLGKSSWKTGSKCRRRRRRVALTEK